MEKHIELTDSALEQQLSDGSLDPGVFSHEAHLRIAWIHITRYGLSQALVNIQHQLKTYVTQIGAEGKYNTTLTVAAIKAVDHFIRKSDSDNFAGFIQEFPRLKNDFKNLMACHYGIDIYNLPEAKTKFVEPDLLPFT